MAGRPPKKKTDEEFAEPITDEKEAEEPLGTRCYVSLDSSNLVITIDGGKYDHRISDIIRESVEAEFEPIRDDAELMAIGFYSTNDPELIAGIEKSEVFQSGRVLRVKDLEEGIKISIKEYQRKVLAEAATKGALVDSEEFVG